MERYSILDLAVCGDGNNSYVVNNCKKIGEVDIDLTGINDRDEVIVIDALVGSNVLTADAREEVYVDFTYSYSSINVYLNDDKPLYYLRRA